ncbi:MAG TPA: AAA family ATPase [Acidobacteriaceae bacterium]|jgi:predicted kinase
MALTDASRAHEHELRLHRILIVSGPPGSGKTTLARPLARQLGFALLCKDDLKESLYTSLGGARGDLDFSSRIGRAAMDLLWVLAARCPAAVLEANFRTRSPEERAHVAALNGQIVEVHCRLPLEEASRRFARRARDERHHPAHPLQEMPPERMAEYEGPFAMSPVIEVDTTQPVNLDALILQVNAAWAEPLNPSAPTGHLE